MAFRLKTVVAHGLFLAGCMAASLGASADPAESVLGSALLEEAMRARAKAADLVTDNHRMVVIDYTKPSSAYRFYLVNLLSGDAEAFLVAHGRGSDPDYDGFADTFSNTPNSKMSSLGAFVTGETYYGRHGLSLRLHGLEQRNDKALERAIVIHGASYVEPGRAILGRSWGCPALEQAVAEKLIPAIAGGTFIYAAGPDEGGD